MKLSSTHKFRNPKFRDSLRSFLKESHIAVSWKRYKTGSNDRLRIDTL